MLVGAGMLANSIRSLAVGGHISLISSSLSRSGTMLDPLLLGGRGMALGSISVGSRAHFEAMNRALALHRLRPVIDRVFPSGFTHQTALIAKPARQPRALIWKR